MKWTLALRKIYLGEKKPQKTQSLITMKDIVLVGNLTAQKTLGPDSFTK